jgi:hypothetical protein
MVIGIPGKLITSWTPEFLEGDTSDTTGRAFSGIDKQKKGRKRTAEREEERDTNDSFRTKMFSPGLAVWHRDTKEPLWTSDLPSVR